MTVLDLVIYQNLWRPGSSDHLGELTGNVIDALTPLPRQTITVSRKKARERQEQNRGTAIRQM